MDKRGREPFVQKADITLAGSVGLAGTFQILHANRKLLEKNFPASFLEGADQILSKEDPKRLALTVKAMSEEDFGLVYICEGGPGGIEADLWKAGEAVGSGLSADIGEIPIHQETVEIAEFLNIDPYRLDSAGSWVILSENGRSVTEYFKRLGFRAATVGALTSDKGRILLFDHGREKRFLERVRSKEISEGKEEEKWKCRKRS